MDPLPITLRILAVIGVVTCLSLYFASHGKLGDMDQLLVYTQEANDSLTEELKQTQQQLEETKTELNELRDQSANTKRSEESLRSEIFTARQELKRATLELDTAQEKITALEATGRRLREDLVAAEQSFAKPSVDPVVQQLNQRIIELENQNLYLTRELHKLTK